MIGGESLTLRRFTRPTQRVSLQGRENGLCAQRSRRKEMAGETMAKIEQMFVILGGFSLYPWGTLC